MNRSKDSAYFGALASGKSDLQSTRYMMEGSAHNTTESLLSKMIQEQRGADRARNHREVLLLQSIERKRGMKKGKRGLFNYTNLKQGFERIQKFRGGSKESDIKLPSLVTANESTSPAAK